MRNRPAPTETPEPQDDERGSIGLRSTFVGSLSAVLAWRGALLFLQRWSELARSGELRDRIARRRRAGLEAELRRRGLAATGARWGVVDRVLARERMHAHGHPAVALAVAGGPGGGASDEDGLLEQAVRRPVTPPPVRRGHRPPPPPPPRPGSSRPIVVERSEHAQDVDAVRELLHDHDRRRSAWLAKVPLWTTLLAILGAALTIVPLVRPLVGAAPWLAAAGVVLVLVAWGGARR